MALAADRQEGPIGCEVGELAAQGPKVLEFAGYEPLVRTRGAFVGSVPCQPVVDFLEEGEVRFRLYVGRNMREALLHGDELVDSVEVWRP